MYIVCLNSLKFLSCSSEFLALYLLAKKRILESEVSSVKKCLPTAKKTKRRERESKGSQMKMKSKKDKE